MLASAMAGYTGKRRPVATPIGHRQPELVAEKATCPTCGEPAELGLPYTSSTPDETVVNVVKRVGTCKSRELRKHTPTKYKSECCPSWIVIVDAVETVTNPTLPRFAKGDDMEKTCRKCSPETRARMDACGATVKSIRELLGMSKGTVGNYFNASSHGCSQQTESKILEAIAKIEEQNTPTLSDAPEPEPEPDVTYTEDSNLEHIKQLLHRIENYPVKHTVWTTGAMVCGFIKDIIRLTSGLNHREFEALARLSESQTGILLVRSR